MSHQRKNKSILNQFIHEPTSLGPTINDVVCRVTTATPVITFGISCWHLARQDTECASNATETSRRSVVCTPNLLLFVLPVCNDSINVFMFRCLQQHRVDAFTQTEAFHFEYGTNQPSLLLSSL